MGTHYVKCVAAGNKRFQFLGTGFRLTNLKIHALRFSEDKAVRLAAEIVEENEGWQAKAVQIGKVTT